jgi:hypothetical protein
MQAPHYCRCTQSQVGAEHVCAAGTEAERHTHHHAVLKRDPVLCSALYWVRYARTHARTHARTLAQKQTQTYNTNPRVRVRARIQACRTV